MEKAENFHRSPFEAILIKFCAIVTSACKNVTAKTFKFSSPPREASIEISCRFFIHKQIDEFYWIRNNCLSAAGDFLVSITFLNFYLFSSLSLSYTYLKEVVTGAWIIQVESNFTILFKFGKQADETLDATNCVRRCLWSGSGFRFLLHLISICWFYDAGKMIEFLEMEGKLSSIHSNHHSITFLLFARLMTRRKNFVYFALVSTFCLHEKS